MLETIVLFFKFESDNIMQKFWYFKFDLETGQRLMREHNGSLHNLIANI